MAAAVISLAARDHLEGVHGRSVRLCPDDIAIGAYGNRCATDFSEDYLPTGPQVHLSTSGGLVGTVASAHASRLPPTESQVVGAPSVRSGTPLSLEGHARPEPPHAEARWDTFGVLGSSMNAGKTTTTAAAMARGWTRAGPRAGAGRQRARARPAARTADVPERGGLVVHALTRLVEGRALITSTRRPALTRLATGTVHLRDGVVNGVHRATEPQLTHEQR